MTQCTIKVEKNWKHISSRWCLYRKSTPKKPLGKVFPANHLAMVLSIKIYQNQNKYRKTTKPNKTKLTCFSRLLQHLSRKKIGSILTKNCHSGAYTRLTGSTVCLTQNWIIVNYWRELLSQYQSDDTTNRLCPPTLDNCFDTL